MIHVIKAREIVTHGASTHEDGEKIFKVILPLLQASVAVKIDFEECLCTPSFIGDAFCSLLDHLTFDHIKKHLSFCHANKLAFACIRESMEDYHTEIENRKVRTDGKTDADNSI